MPRLRLEMPASFPFATEIDVRVTDLNYGGHLGNDSALTLVHEARVRFLRARDLSEGNVGGAHIILTDAVLVFLAEGFAGDRLRFEVAVGNAARASCDFFYRATRLGDDRVVLEAKTGAVFLHATTRRVVPLPDEMKALAAAG